ncbi:MAG: cobaltochelatase subunit CobN, partial [Pseudomonadota bacterium]
MRDDTGITGRLPGYRVVIVTLDAHAAGPIERAAGRLSADFPGLTVSVHAAAEWGEAPEKLEAAKHAVETGDIVITALLFLEDHVRAILPSLEARRPHCDAMIGMVSDAAIVKTTRMGNLDMGAPASGAMALLKKLRGSSKPSTESGAKKMRLLRRLPKILKYIPGKSQDLRAWFLTMQYWLASSDENIEGMVRFLVSRYAQEETWKTMKAPAPMEYPDVGLYHPRLKGRITTDPAKLPKPKLPVGTVGILMMRSYVLSSDCAHYDAVIEAMEARGLRVIPAFAGGLDGRPAVDAYFQGPEGAKIDALVSLSGFSLVGGPAYNDNDAAIKVLKDLDIPYLAAHPLEFQTLDQWSLSKQGLGPIETTMLIALPELDGATNPTVFAGRHGPEGCKGCPNECAAPKAAKAMSPCHERIDRLVDKTLRQVRLRQAKAKNRKVGIVLFGFPPNAGAAGTAAYLDVFRSLHNTLHALKAQGYTLDPPETVEELRATILGGSAAQYGQEANVAAHVDADTMVSQTPWLKEIEEIWG